MAAPDVGAAAFLIIQLQNLILVFYLQYFIKNALLTPLSKNVNKFVDFQPISANLQKEIRPVIVLPRSFRLPVHGLWRVNWQDFFAEKLTAKHSMDTMAGKCQVRELPRKK